MIIVGDVHGQMLMLEKLLESFDAGTEVCFVGDLVDRGPRSREVVKFVRDGGHHTVLGNHEDMMVSCLLPLLRGEELSNGLLQLTCRTVARSVAVAPPGKTRPHYAIIVG